MKTSLLFAAALLLGACTEDGDPDVGALPYHGEKLTENHARIFADVDTDGNGTLSREEIETAPGHASMLAKYFDDIDTDGDGELTHPEIVAFMHVLH